MYVAVVTCHSLRLVRTLELRLDEFGKRAVGEEVGRECGGRTVYANTGLHFPIVSVEKLEQGHMYARITLKHVPDRGGIEVLFPFHEGIEGRVYGCLLYTSRCV